MAEAAVFQSSPGPISAASPSGSSSTDGTASTNTGMISSAPQLTSLDTKTLAQETAAHFPPPKTDKPRPHVCATCTRSFARLEHLKRHERSHTKEKPFECPECTRCFARRDLLLRHQQKLHMTTTPASRPRGGRRESANGIAPNSSSRVRKHSTSGSVSGMNGIIGNGPRPRANTISHVDGGTLGMLAAANRSAGNLGPAGNAMARGPGMMDPRGMSSSIGHRGNAQALPRLETGQPMELGGGLRTAPPGAMHFDLNNQSFSFGSTVNPAQLHLSESGGFTQSPFGAPNSPFTPQPAIMEDDDTFEWMSGFNTQMSFTGANGQTLAESSPSQMSNGSPHGGFRETFFDKSPIQAQSNHQLWSNGRIGHQGQTSNGNTLENGGPGFGAFDVNSQTINPGSLQAVNAPEGMYNGQNSMLSGFNGHFNHNPAFSPESTSVGSSSVNGSARHSSVTSVSTESITDVTRQALLVSLSQPSAFGGHGARKYSQPTISSPLSPRDSTKSNGVQAPLPSTYDLQRFVGAYIQYFHPHFPFLHVATLSFDTPAYTSNIRAANGTSNYAHGGIVGGGGCLILAMAAIGALYEYDRPASKELFEAAKRMIQLYLEERRKADVQSPPNSSRPGNDLAAQNTPLWLVQAMLLNVIYGHNCGDKTSGDIASTHCTALVSLARAAELTHAISEFDDSESLHRRAAGSNSGADVTMSDGNEFHDPWGSGGQNMDEQTQWYKWISVEERKRTLFAIFHMSSLLVSAYNHAPALMNSEIQLDLPCDEELWTAGSARLWAVKRSQNLPDNGAVPFVTALSQLLSASQKQQDHRAMSHEQPFGSGMPLDEVPPSDLKPSTFGCLVLIDALHNYIWETRQRHSGRQWTTQETESMHAHIEPALRAWQAAWTSNPSHSLERPNPFGLGPLSADSIPLLDLAYVRLFVNLGTSKEAFWQRDFDTMADELARGSEIIQHAEHSGDSTGSSNSANASRHSPSAANGSADVKIPLTPTESTHSAGSNASRHSCKRERHLRKAAFYAADSLSMSDKLGVTFADFTSRELPVQSALCTFDCAQILAEWVATVQERIGRYLGVLGRDSIDYTQVPAIMLLGEEDSKLLNKVADILDKAERKITSEMHNVVMTPEQRSMIMHSLPSASSEGFGSKLLKVTAFMLDRAAVWPVTQIMSQGLMIQAEHMWKRAESSVSAQ